MATFFSVFTMSISESSPLGRNQQILISRTIADVITLYIHMTGINYREISSTIEAVKVNYIPLWYKHVIYHILTRFSHELSNQRRMPKKLA